MINKAETATNNQFKMFPNSDNKKYYLLSKEENNVVRPEKPIDTAKIKSQNNKRKKRLTLAISSSAILAGGGALLLSRGLPKNTEKYLESLKKFLEKKLEKSKWSGSTSWSEFWIYSIRKVESFTEKAQSLNNFTSLKDVAFKNLMDRTRPSARIHKSITSFFERLARRTVISSYKKTNNAFQKMYSSFEKLDEIILKSNPDEIIKYGEKTYTKKELVELARQHRSSVKRAVEGFTSNTSLRSRYRTIKETTSALYSTIWNQITKGFWSKDNIFIRKEMWQTYLADNQIFNKRKALSDSVAQIRNKISYTDKDKTMIISEHLKVLKNLIIPSDKEGLNTIKKLEWFLDNPEGLETNSENFIKILTSLKDRPIEEGLETLAAQNQFKLREDNIDLIKNLFDVQEQGKLQEMLNIYKKIAPYELAQSKAETYVRKAVSSFDKALRTETSEFFNKVRDLQLGSAPTDILSILVSAATIAYGLGEAANSDERKTVMLTAGIPILGTIGTTIVCTTQLISGFVSLGIGLGVGTVFKILGEGIDKFRHSRLMPAQISQTAKNHTNG